MTDRNFISPFIVRCKRDTRASFLPKNQKIAVIPSYRRVYLPGNL